MCGFSIERWDILWLAQQFWCVGLDAWFPVLSMAISSCPPLLTWMYCPLNSKLERGMLCSLKEGAKTFDRPTCELNLSVCKSTQYFNCHRVVFVFQVPAQRQIVDQTRRALAESSFSLSLLWTKEGRCTRCAFSSTFAASLLHSPTELLVLWSVLCNHHHDGQHHQSGGRGLKHQHQS